MPRTEQAEPSVPAKNNRGRMLAAICAATLLIGYADLARGGVTIAPLLLVIGYIGLVPAVILTW